MSIRLCTRGVPAGRKSPASRSQDCKATVLHLFLLIKIIFIYNFYNLIMFPTLFVIDYVGKNDRSERCVKCLFVHFTMRTVCFLWMSIHKQKL